MARSANSGNHRPLIAVACVIVVVAGGALATRVIRTNQDAAASVPTIGSGPVPAEREAAPAPHQSPIAATDAITGEDAAREASWREAREAAIRVQQRLRNEEHARKATQQEETKRERCVGGQRMKRIENGWVQAGTC
jgi:hypothetical protein